VVTLLPDLWLANVSGSLLLSRRVIVLCYPSLKGNGIYALLQPEITFLLQVENDIWATSQKTKYECNVKHRQFLFNTAVKSEPQEGWIFILLFERSAHCLPVFLP